MSTLTHRKRGPRQASPSLPVEVLHVVPKPGRIEGGVGQTVLGLTEEQRKLGGEVAICCYGADGVEREDTVSEHGATVYSFSTTGPQRLGWSREAERWAASHQGARFGVVHQHSIWTAISRVTHAWRKAHARPTVVAPQGSLEDVALSYSRLSKALAYHAYERANLKAATCLQATHESEAESFRRFGLTNPIAIIPNGVSEAWLDRPADGDRFRSQWGIPDNERLVLFLSRLHRKKGLDILLRAITHLDSEHGAALESGPEWVLVVAGPVEDEDHVRRCERYLREVGLGHRVQMIGPLFSQDKRDAFAASDVFVLPSRSDNFGIVVAEALGAATPAITTRGVLPWSVLHSHRCGWWTSCDPEDIAGALLEALTLPPEKLEAMGRRGRELVRAQFPWSRAARQTMRLYGWLGGTLPRPDFVYAD